MDQLAAMAWGLVIVIGILSAFGAVAMAFGADSRRSIGDTHTTTRVSDWW